MNAIDMKGAQLIAHASSENPCKPRWTELEVYYRPDASAPWVVRSIGRSRAAGQTDLVSQAAFYDLDMALSWFADSALRRQVAATARGWRNGRQMVQPRPAPDAPLRAVFAWLYGVDETDVPTARVADDFGLPRRTVQDVFKRQATGDPGSPWAGALARALRLVDPSRFAEVARG